MKRDALSQLTEWKERRNRKPLILNGARQVGKTWLMKEFGRTSFKNTAYVNFDGNPILKSVFEQDFDVRLLIASLQIETHQTIDPKNTLLILDEIQTAPAALTTSPSTFRRPTCHTRNCCGSPFRPSWRRKARDSCMPT